MQINFEQLRSIIKQSKIPVFRDGAPINQDYPYIVYEFVNEQYKRASNKVLKDMPLYQIALITDGTEADLKSLKTVFNDAGVAYSSFDGMPYEENDSRVTQFITYVRCVNG
jgi:hypothetical protein